MWTFFILVMVGLVTTVVFLLRHFKGPSVDLPVMISTGVTWTLAMSVLALTPIDMATAMQGDKQDAVIFLWNIAYWTAYALTWTVLPVHQNYTISGEFTVWARIKDSVVRNLKMIVGLLVVGVVGIVFLVASGRMQPMAIFGFLIAANNSFGLGAGIFLMAFGLAELPRLIWKKANHKSHFVWCTVKVGKKAERLETARAELMRVSAVVNATATNMSRRDPLLPLMQRVVDYCEQRGGRALHRQPGGGRGAGGAADDVTLTDDELDYGNDMQGLALLNRRVKKAVLQYEGIKSEYVVAVREALDTEDILHYVQGDRGGAAAPTSRQRGALWIFQCYAEPWVRRLAALTLAGMSVCIVLAEATIATGGHPDLSVPSWMIHNARGSALLVSITVFLPLLYMVLCTYFSLFRLAILRKWYFLAPQASSPNSMLMNASLLCRFAYPICFNYTKIVHADDRFKEPMYFSRLMMRMDNIPFFGGAFNTFYPLLGVVFFILIAFNAWGRILGDKCGFLRFDQEDLADEHGDRGRLILAQERAAIAQGNPLGSWLESGEPMSTVPRAGGAAAAFLAHRGELSSGGRRQANEGGAKSLWGRMWGDKKGGDDGDKAYLIANDAPTSSTYTGAPGGGSGRAGGQGAGGSHYSGAAAAFAAASDRPGGARAALQGVLARIGGTGSGPSPAKPSSSSDLEALYSGLNVSGPGAAGTQSQGSKQAKGAFQWG